MSGRAFLDTNVLVYLFDDDEPTRQQRARDVLAASPAEYVVSTQVLGEFYVVTTRTLTRPLDAEAAARAVRQIAEFIVVPADLSLVTSAIETSRIHRVSYWDALIIEAAASADCDRLLSEDLANDSTLRGVRVENPFADLAG